MNKVLKNIYNAELKSRLKLICVTSLAAFIVSCASPPEQSEFKHLAQWSSGYEMIGLLAESITISQMSDLEIVLNASWYDAFAVTHTKSAKYESFSDCATYLSNATAKTRTLQPNDMGPFLEIAAMCRSTEVLSRAESFSQSYIPEEFLNQSSIDSFPSAFAIDISRTEAEQHANDPRIKYWGDINKVNTVEVISKERVKFTHSGGNQQIDLVGRGDFNGDDIEDLLLVSRDSVEGGSYFNMRLFSITADKNGEWVLLEAYTH